MGLLKQKMVSAMGGIGAFVVAVSTPITTVSIIFFILFTIIALPFFISIICDLFGR